MLVQIFRQIRLRGFRTCTRTDLTARVELGYLGLASLYALSIPLRGGIHWVDGVVLIGLCAAYAWRLSKEERSEPELEGVAKQLGDLPQRQRRVALTVLFLWAAFIVVLVSKPFADALVDGGRILGMDEFLLVQWVAGTPGG